MGQWGESQALICRPRALHLLASRGVDLGAQPWKTVLWEGKADPAVHGDGVPGNPVWLAHPWGPVLLRSFHEALVGDGAPLPGPRGFLCTSGSGFSGAWPATLCDCDSGGNVTC